MPAEMLRRRLASFAALLFAALAGGLWLGAGPGRPEAQQAHRPEPLLAVDARAVARLRLTNEGGSVLLERVGDQWRIREPSELAADASSAEALLNALAEARLVHAGDVTAEAAGLAPPRYTVTVEGAGERWTIEAGKRSVFDGRVYVRRADGPIGLTAGDLVYQLAKTAAHLRDARLLPVDPTGVRRFELQRSGGGIRLERRGAEWTIATPPGTPGDPDRINQLLHELAALRGRRFVSEGATAEELARYGLAKPVARVVLDGRELSFGRVRQGGQEKIFAGALGAPVAEVAAAELLARLPVEPAELIDMRLLRFERDLVHRIVVRGSGDPFALQRGAAGWTVGDGEGAQPVPAKESEVFALLYRLGALRAERLVREPPSVAELAQRGLLDPAQRLELYDDAGRLLGALDAGAAFGSQRWVKGVGTGSVDGGELGGILLGRDQYTE